MIPTEIFTTGQIEEWIRTCRADGGPWPCPFAGCQRVSVSVDYFRRHLRDVHPGQVIEGRIPCARAKDGCEETFASRAELEEHLRGGHPPRMPDPGQGPAEDGQAKGQPEEGGSAMAKGEKHVCPDCGFEAAHAMGLGRPRTARHGVKSKREKRGEGSKGGAKATRKPSGRRKTATKRRPRQGPPSTPARATSSTAALVAPPEVAPVATNGNGLVEELEVLQRLARDFEGLSPAGKRWFREAIGELVTL